MQNALKKIQSVIFRTRILYVFILFWFYIKAGIDSIINFNMFINVGLKVLVVYGLILFVTLTLSIKNLLFKSFYVIFVYLTILTALIITPLNKILDADAVFDIALIFLLVYFFTIILIHPSKNNEKIIFKFIQKYRYEAFIFFQLLFCTILFVVVAVVNEQTVEYYEFIYTKEFVFSSTLFYLTLYFYVYNNNIANKQTDFMLNLYKPGYYKMYGKRKVDLSGKNISCFHVDDEIKILYKYKYFIKDCKETIYTQGALLLFDTSKELAFFISKNNKVYNVKVILEKNEVGLYYVKNTIFYDTNVITTFLYNKFSKFYDYVGLTTKFIDKVNYLKFMFSNNIYYKNKIEDELNNTLSKKEHSDQNIICINGKYREGKTTYVSTLTGLLNNDTTFFSYSDFKYDDILSDILLSFTKFFKPHILSLVGIYFAVFSFVSLIIINVIDVTGIKPVVIIQLYNTLKEGLLMVVSNLAFINTSSNLFQSISDTDILIMVSIIFLVILAASLKSREFFLLTFNFGTSKTSNNIINIIADKLEKTDKKIIIEDLDRLDFYEDIYYEMLKISKLHNNNSNGINVYLTVGIDIIKRKYAEHMIAKNLQNVKPYNKMIVWCLKDKPCDKCKGKNQCDLHSLLSKNFIIHDTYFKNIRQDYMDEIKEIDHNLFKHLNSIDIINMMNLKQEIQNYYNGTKN